MERCPICKSELVRVDQQGSPMGLEESTDECHSCNKYSEVFAYGDTELHIGTVAIGYGYRTPPEAVEAIKRAVCEIGEAIRKQNEQDNDDEDESPSVATEMTDDDVEWFRGAMD